MMGTYHSTHNGDMDALKGMSDITKKHYPDGFPESRAAPKAKQGRPDRCGICPFMPICAIVWSIDDKRCAEAWRRLSKWAGK